MMNISEQSHASIASALEEALSRYAVKNDSSVVTDIHLQPKQDSGELVVFNDDDEDWHVPLLLNGWIMMEKTFIQKSSHCSVRKLQH